MGGRAIRDAGYALRPLMNGGNNKKPMILSNDNLIDCIPCTFDRNYADTKIKNKNIQNYTTYFDDSSTSSLSCHERRMYTDIWIESRMKSMYNNTIPSLDETIFFKTSRFLPQDIAQRINYTDQIFWAWK